MGNSLFNSSWSDRGLAPAGGTRLFADRTQVTDANGLGSFNDALMARRRWMDAEIGALGLPAAQSTTAILPAARQAPIDLAAAVPADAIMILSALEAGSASRVERRSVPRLRLRRRALLRLFVDQPSTEPWQLFTSDASQRGLGFIARLRLPLGCGGEVELLAPDGEPVRIACTLYRCRRTQGEWFAGALSFNRDQPQFAANANAEP